MHLFHTRHIGALALAVGAVFDLHRVLADNTLRMPYVPQQAALLVVAGAVIAIYIRHY